MSEAEGAPPETRTPDLPILLRDRCGGAIAVAVVIAKELGFVVLDKRGLHLTAKGKSLLLDLSATLEREGAKTDESH